MALQEKTGEALAELVEDEVPEPLVDTEMQNRLQDLAMRLQAQGIGLDQYLAATGNDQEAFVAELRDTATQAVKVDLALRAVAEAEGIEVDRRGPRGGVRGGRRAGRPEARAGAQAVRAQRAGAVGTLRPQEAQGPRMAAGAGRGGR